MARRRPRRLLDLMTWDGRRNANSAFRIAGNADGHHASAGRALRAGAVNARRPRGTRGRSRAKSRANSRAKSIDGAEHSSTLSGVMAVVRSSAGSVSDLTLSRQQNAIVIARQNPFQIAI